MTDPLEQIKERNAKRTPGPWKLQFDGYDYSVIAPDDEPGTMFIAEKCMQGSRDADFIAHAPEDLDWLIAEVEKLRSRYSELRTAVGAGWAVLDKALGVYAQHVDPPTPEEGS